MSLLAVAHDPGGANVVAATVDTLRRQGHQVRAVAAGPARARFTALGIDHDIADGDDPARWADTGARLLIAGTSAVAPLERNALRWAQQQQMPAVALIDYWANHRMRFAPSGDPAGPALFPDVITAPDEDCARAMIDDGLPPDHVTVIGQPYFGWLLERRRAIPRVIDGPVLFASEAGAQEDLALAAVISALEDLPSPPPLLIRFHPRQTDREPSLRRLVASRLRHGIDDAADPHETLRRCRVVLGIGSVLLIEAALMGVPAASVARGTRPHLPTIATGFTPALATTGQIQRFVQDAPIAADAAFVRTHRDAHTRAAALCLALSLRPR